MSYYDLKNERYKIFYIEYDENGNEISRGVDDKTYSSRGWAWNRIEKKYGDKRFHCHIAKRDPFVNYYNDAVCDICGCSYSRPEDDLGCDIGATIAINRRYKKVFNERYIYYNVCPKCIDEVLDTVQFKAKFGGKSK